MLLIALFIFTSRNPQTPSQKEPKQNGSNSNFAHTNTTKTNGRHCVLPQTGNLLSSYHVAVPSEGCPLPLVDVPTSHDVTENLN